MRIDVVFGEFFGQVLVVLSEACRIGGIVEGDEDGVFDDANVAVKALKEVFAKVAGLPSSIGFAAALAELVDNGLGDKGQGQLGVANV